jgi:hypothetical protein
MSALFALAPPATGPVLRDIHVPPPPPWWPPAPGWWVLAIVVLLGALAAIFWWRRRRRVHRRVAAVLAELDALAAQHALDGDDATLAAGLHRLLRRAARRRDAAAAHASGEAWRHLLAQVPTDASTLAALLVLDQAIYRPQPFDQAAALAAVRRWLSAALRLPAKAVTHA